VLARDPDGNLLEFAAPRGPGVPSSS
jgi:hypothetical protein